MPPLLPEAVPQPETDARILCQRVVNEESEVHNASEKFSVKWHPALQNEGTTWQEFDFSSDICGGYGGRKVIPLLFSDSFCHKAVACAERL
jgi:hypothetical protein